jgi:hypothetical protein
MRARNPSSKIVEKSLSLLGDVNHVVIRDSIDQFVIGINARACRHPIHDNLEGLVSLSDLLLLEVKRLLFALLANEDANVNVIAQFTTLGWKGSCVQTRLLNNLGLT